MGKSERVIDCQELLFLKSDVDRGIRDLAAGRVANFDVNRIIERGKRHRIRSSMSSVG